MPRVYKFTATGSEQGHGCGVSFRGDENMSTGQASVAQPRNVLPSEWWARQWFILRAPVSSPGLRAGPWLGALLGIPCDWPSLCLGSCSRVSSSGMRGTFGNPSPMHKVAASWVSTPPFMEQQTSPSAITAQPSHPFLSCFSSLSVLAFACRPRLTAAQGPGQGK